MRCRTQINPTRPGLSRSYTIKGAPVAAYTTAGEFPVCRGPLYVWGHNEQGQLGIGPGTAAWRWSGSPSARAALPCRRKARRGADSRRRRRGPGRDWRLGRGTAARMVFARRTLVVLSVSTHMGIGDAYFDHVPAQRGSHLRWKAVCAVPAPVWPQFPEGHRNAHARATHTHTRMHSVEPALRRCGVAKAEAHAKCAGLTRLRTT